MPDRRDPDEPEPSGTVSAHDWLIARPVKTKSHLGDDWRGQWARVERWQARLQPARNSLPDEGSSAQLAILDDVYAFFMNCYHLKDWFIQSGARTKGEVEKHVNDSEALSLCGDICNGLKHYRLDPARAPETRTYSGKWSTTSSTMTDSGSPARWYFTDTPRGNWDMFELADECVESWRRFIGTPIKA